MQLLRDLAMAVPPLRRLRESRNALAARVADLESQLKGSGNSPFFHYAASFDATGMMRRHAVADLQPDPDHLTNFLGVKIAPKFLPEILQGRQGHVEEIPIPANWHADIAEWAAALRAVELAKGDFTVMELGCGWGCWIANSGVAARSTGLKPHLIGVEGDAGHVAFAQECCTTNGFKPDEVEIHHAIAGAHAGVALFPKQEAAGGTWGLEALFNPTAAELAQARKTGSYDELPVIALSEIAARHARIDLLHIDIQGAEADLVEAALPFLAEKVGYMLIGTHAREIEGRLFKALLAEGWLLEIERPAIVDLSTGKPVVVVDGVQGWRNLRLNPLA